MQLSVVLFCLCASAMAELPKGRAKVVVLSIAGLGMEYLQNENKLLPNLKSLYEQSAKPEYLAPVVPTKSDVNLYSIATGLYAEHHGEIDNLLLDERTHTINSKHFTTLWKENHLKGGFSGVMTWPLVDTDKFYGENYIAHYANYQKYTLIPSYKDRVTKIIDWLKHDIVPSNLVMANFRDLETILREDEAYSKRLLGELDKLDQAVGFLIKQLNTHGLKGKVNLIIHGTQGMSSARYNGGIRLNDILSGFQCTLVRMGTNAIVTPMEGQWDDVYDALVKNAKTADGKPKYDIYEQSKIPEQWHLKGLKAFSGSLYLVAHLEYFFWNDQLDEIVKSQISGTSPSGKKIGSRQDFVACFDGYSDEEAITRTFLMATGPDFEPRMKVTPFQTIDIYPLIRELVGLTGTVDGRQPAEMKGQVRQLLSSGDSQTTTTCTRIMDTAQTVLSNLKSKSSSKSTSKSP